MRRGGPAYYSTNLFHRLRLPRSYRIGLVSYAAALGVLATGLSLALPSPVDPRPGYAELPLASAVAQPVDAPPAMWGGYFGGAEADDPAPRPSGQPVAPDSPEYFPVASQAAAAAVIEVADTGSALEQPRPSPLPAREGLLIPDPTRASGAGSAQLRTTLARRPFTYGVAPGDTVSTLAERFGISIRTIVRANALANPESLSVGQELVVLPISGTLHTVAAGDTVVDLAGRYGVIPEEIIAVNALKEPYLIFPGQKLLMPEVPEVARETPTAPEAQSGSRPLEPLSYDVADGDTASGIASRFGVSLENLLAANGLDASQRLTVGRRLIVPPSGTALHVVREGDTVTGVAALFGASAVGIIRANALAEPYLLEVGRRVVVPGGTSPVRVTAAPIREAARPAASPTSVARPTYAAVASSPQPRPHPTPASPAPRPAPASPGQPAAGSRVVSIALKYQGYRYVWGGTNPESGFDCSGFVMYVLRQAGVPVPRDLWGQLNSGSRVSRSALQPGDLVFFQNTYRPGLSHDGIYVGGGQFVHAASENSGVIVSRLDHPYWGVRYLAASRPY